MQAYIGRQVIIGRDQNILGYELLFRHAADAIQAQFDDDVEAGVQVMANLLTRMGTEWLLGDKLAVINVSAAMLDSEFIELLPPSRVVLDVVGALPVPVLVERCRHLRANGFAIALNNVQFSLEEPSLFAVADYLYFDVQHQDLAALETTIKSLGQLGTKKLIAKRVETPSEFLACQQMGFHYFQGHHFAHPETLSMRVIDPAYGRIIDLLNLVRTNADSAEIEAAIKRDVALPPKLFHYINSAGFGMARPVYSIRQALAMVGYRQLYRWLSLLVVTSAGAATPPALARTALIRARLMELLGQPLLSTSERDSLFIVGLFSLLDVILDIPMDRLLQMLNPPDTISEALLHQRGPYGPWLELVKACENIDAAYIGEIAQSLGLAAVQVNEAHLNALAWVEELEM